MSTDEEKMSLTDKKILKLSSEGHHKELEAALRNKGNPNVAKVRYACGKGEGWCARVYARVFLIVETQPASALAVGSSMDVYIRCGFAFKK